MKKLKLLSLLLFAVPVLAGCNQPSDTPTTPENPDLYKITDYGTLEFADADYICKGGSYGGFFAEVNVGRAIAHSTTYEFVFESSYSSDKSFEITVSNPRLAAANKTGEREFTIATAEAIGDFILKIENAQGILVYRNVIHVKRSYTPEYMPNRLFNIDYFQSAKEYERWYGSWRLSFTGYEDGLVGSLTGGDELEQNVTISFSATYGEFVEGADAYLFNVTTISTTAKQTEVIYFLITRCSDSMYVYEDSGLLAILNASN